MGNKNNKYPYVSTLENPQAYQYSKFIGMKLIESYKESRLKTIRALHLNQPENILQDYIDSMKEFEQYSKEIKIRKLAEENDTKNKLFLLLFMQCNSNKDKEIKKEICRWLNIYLKKFEVSKKIYSKYDSNMKKIGNDYKDQDNYVLLSVNIALFCRNSHNLKFINMLLKINDMLCTMKDEIKSKLIPLVYLSLKIELDEIKKLFKMEGMKI